MRVSDFHFDLPEDLIAQHPPKVRGSSRMLVLQRAPDAGQPVLTDDLFANLPSHLQPGDLLIVNDSRVLPARLFATRAGLATQHSSPRPTGQIEVLLTEQIDSPASPGENLWRALVKPARKVQPGETLLFHGPHDDAAQPALTAQVVATGEFGERTLRFSPIADFPATLVRIGHMPLPPYIHRDQASVPDTPEDRERYQNIYSQATGSAAAPTAGLHFTPEILAALDRRGVEIASVTLHVGLGTFQPVRVSELSDIHLHAERYTLPAATAEALNQALAARRRIVAVGTTTTRTLEHIAQQAVCSNQTAIPGGPSFPASSERVGYLAQHDSEAGLPLHPHSGSTSIFLAPGHRFRIVSGLLTNFHLPESTLLMLVAAFAGSPSNPDQGRQTILAAYAHAIERRYRFYSYGDCMLLL